MKTSALAIAALALCPASPALAQVVNGKDPLSNRLNAWFAAGETAGLEGVYYDNRDRKHSDLGIAKYPQLRPITYTAQERERRVDWGAQRQILGGQIVIGNSSTASPADKAGSHQRMYYVSPRGLTFLYEQYRSNALYIYPEHRDHDPGTNGPDGYGDLYPANSPYLISSQGSSGSDKVFMHAMLKTIAAFPKETRATLVTEGLLMPTLQAIFRRTCKASGDYFSGVAHPSAFDGKQIDEVAMAKLAHAMTPDAVPPLVKLRVLEEVQAEAGRDFFEPQWLAANGERIADSPCAIARVVRAPSQRRTMRVTAADSFDHRGGRQLKFRWVVLRGDPELIAIEPGGRNDVEATISVAYHPRRPIAPGSPLWSNRVDIGVFCETEGSLVSAPAFISFTTLANEHRSYDADGRLLEIFYGARGTGLGMPPADSERWDRLLAHFDDPKEKAVAPRLLAAAMAAEDLEKLRTASAATTDQRQQFTKLAAQLATITSAQQKVVDETNQARVAANKTHSERKTEASKSAMDKAGVKHNAAKQAMREGADGAADLKSQMAERRTAITAAIRNSGVSLSVRRALHSMREDPMFFTNNEAAIRAAIGQSGNPNAAAVLDRSLRELATVGVVLSPQLTSNERYHSGQLNLAILSGILFAEILNAEPAPLYADPRLTSKKYWRDVYDYDSSGKLTGWTRYEDGQQSAFTADGDLIRSRKPDEVVPVRYEIDSESGRLRAVAEE